ncbi:hypothetical protein AHMF7605_26065 [Adhaeribacter arboris]|uniref:TonB-dependent siderophore receptor n=1 Tax=Adhaeribacter arboris TaxID=2072846 RepID=A0A2T2YMH4_9BACT|nr:TonB-dependent receptor [Adhaeribacter arboris]PSR56711.1 hypothetical protein AHMF7605_26065 [Adhaeribacter arboris]
MIKKLAYLSIVLLLLSWVANAQTGSITGKITSSENQSVPFATIRIKGTNNGVVSNESGIYTIQNLALGSYTVQVSLVGFLTQEKQVSISETNMAILDFVLIENVNELQTVEVTGRKQTSYKNDNSFSAAKIEMRIADIPQSISSVTKEFIQDKQAVRLNEVVQNVAGVNQFSNYDDITMRGFRNSGSNGRLINGLRTINTYSTSPLLVNMEKVEFIKGPASAVFSNTNPGGTVNMITKKPLDEARQSIQFGTGSFNTLRTQADFTGPLNDDKTLLYRLNMGLENADTYRKNIINNSVAVAPSLSFLPRAGTRFNADFLYTKLSTQFDNGRTIVDGTKDVLALPMDLNIGQPQDYLHQQNFALTLSFSQALAKGLDLNISYLKVKTKETFGGHGVNEYITPDSVSLAYGVSDLNQYGNNLTAYITFNATTGVVVHTIMGGYDYINGGYVQFYKTAAGLADGVEDFSILRPSYTLRPVENYTYQAANIATYGSDYYTNGVYLQDLIKYQRLSVLLSLRQEFYTYPQSTDLSVQGTLSRKLSQKALLPRIGITYGITNNINVYATYNAGFEAQDSYSISAPGAGGPFNPLTSTLYEAGAKGEFFQKRLFAGWAIYDLTQNNVLVSANIPTQPNLLIQRGQERARGVEVEAGGYITPNLSLQVSYAYNQAIITESTEGDPDQQVGLTKEGAPKNVSGSWIKYSISKGILKGLGFGAGHSQVTKKETYDRALQIPGYLIFNSAVYYKVDRFQISANLNNLTNARYLIGGFNYYRTFPGAPRNYMLGVGYTF